MYKEHTVNKSNQIKYDIVVVMYVPHMNIHGYTGLVLIMLPLMQILPQPQMCPPPVALNQYTWVNRTPKHFIYMVQCPTNILK